MFYEFMLLQEGLSFLNIDHDEPMLFRQGLAWSLTVDAAHVVSARAVSVLDTQLSILMEPEQFHLGLSWSQLKIDQDGTYAASARARLVLNN
jgi:hypothetical protein